MTPVDREQLVARLFELHVAAACARCDAVRDEDFRSDAKFEEAEKRFRAALVAALSPEPSVPSAKTAMLRDSALRMEKLCRDAAYAICGPEVEERGPTDFELEELLTNAAMCLANCEAALRLPSPEGQHHE